MTRSCAMWTLHALLRSSTWVSDIYGTGLGMVSCMVGILGPLLEHW